MNAVLARACVALSLLAFASAPAFAGEAKVKIDNFTFIPDTLEVPAGTTVVWTNEDDIPHALAAVGKAFKSGALDTDESFSFTFTSPGVFDYFCSLHPHMKGKIVVK